MEDTAKKEDARIADRSMNPAIMDYLEPIDNPRYEMHKVGRTPERVRARMERIRDAIYRGESR